MMMVSAEMYNVPHQLFSVTSKKSKWIRIATESVMEEGSMIYVARRRPVGTNARLYLNQIKGHN